MSRRSWAWRLAWGIVLTSGLLGSAGTPTPQMVAVMEFAPTRTGPDQAEHQWLSKGLSDLLIGDLGRAPELRVVTREHCLMLAEEAGLRAELASRASLPEEEVRKLNMHFKVDRVVFGAYTVQGDRITVHAQVLDAGNGLVLARFSEEGLAAHALDVEKHLARKMLAFFAGRDSSAESVTLPQWTDSTTAAKRLYEGVAAFDAGQYNQAWHRFQQALTTDPNYADARYWVARMYYYRQDYDHARIEYDRFLHAFPAHGRVGDAVMEFVHTQEGSARGPEDVLGLYRRFRERGFQGVEVHNQVDYVGTSPLSDWLIKREQQALVYSGRLAEAFSLLDRELRQSGSGGAWRDESRNLLSLIAETAADVYGERLCSEFAPYRDIALTLDHPEAGEDLTASGMRGAVYKWGTNYRILAPPGFAFKTLKAHVVSTSDPAAKTVARLQVRRYRYVDIDCCWTASSTNPAPRLDRVHTIAMPPGCTWFYLRPEYVGVDGDQGHASNNASFDAWRIEAGFEPVGKGRVSLEVLNAHEFGVRLDGINMRSQSGSLGAIPEGNHTIRVESMWPRKAWGYLPLETNLAVVAGLTQRVRVELRLSDTASAAGWRAPVGIAAEYPTYKHRPRRNTNWRNGPPSVAVHARTGVRTAVWAHLDDLWFSVCTNGVDWSTPDLLPLPVNSAHVDINPRLLVDDRDRYCLLFLSDRGQARNLCAYASWSRDLRAWSRPVQVSAAHYTDLDLIQDNDGRYILACAIAPAKGLSRGGVELCMSPDLLTWTNTVHMPLAPSAGNIGIRQDDAGQIHLVWTRADDSCSVNYSRSADLRQWTPPVSVRVQRMFHPRSLSLEVMGDMLILATCTEDGMYSGDEVFTLHGLSLSSHPGVWRPLTIPPGMVVGMPSLACDAAAKDLFLAWQVGDLFLNPTRSSGPVYVMAGRPQFAMPPDPEPLPHEMLDRCTAAAMKKRMTAQDVTRTETDECAEAFDDYATQIQARGARDSRDHKPFPVDQAEHYVQALKMSVIDPERHGGWPYRHAQLKSVYLPLQKQVRADAEPVRLAAVVIPALVNGEVDEAAQACRWLAALDPFWFGYITGLVRNHVMDSREFLDKVGAP